MRRTDIRLFSTDLDGTLLGEPSATARFTALWSALPLGIRPLLVYNTGRTVKDTLGLVAARGLPEPDYVIGSLGTELHDSMYQQSDEFRVQFGMGWDLECVDAIVGTFAGPRPQPGEFRHRYKSSWYWARAHSHQIDELRAKLSAAHVRASVIYSCRYFLDVVPACAGKGRALAWLCRRLNIPTARVLVAGDTGNDAEMFQLPGTHGIVVENALQELRSAVPPSLAYFATAPMADGVIEGLRAYGVFPAVPESVLPD